MNIYWKHFHYYVLEILQTKESLIQGWVYYPTACDLTVVSFIV